MKSPDKNNSNGRISCIYGKENGFEQTSGFGEDRTDPKKPFGTRTHHGIDFAAPEGTPISAPLDGKVLFNDFNGTSDYGYVVILKHVWSDGLVFYTLYAHMKDKSHLTVGSKVKYSDIVGYVGKTGKQGMQPHLHFEVILRKEINCDIVPTDNGSIGIKPGKGRICPKEFACKLKTIKSSGEVYALELCGIDTGEKCMGNHKDPWAVGCVYGVTLGQMAAGFSRAAATGDWSLDPCAVFCGIWKVVKQLKGEITVFDKLIIKTPAGFFVAQGTAFTISVSENLKTTLAVKNGEVEFIPAGRLTVLTFTRGEKVTFAGKTGDILQKSSGNRNYADGVVEWTREVAKRRIPSIMPSIVCRQVVEIRPEGSVYCYSRSGSRKLTMSEKMSGAPQNAKEQIKGSEALTPPEKLTNIISAQEQAGVVCDIKADYKGISWNITSLSLYISFKGRNAPDGKEFLLMDLTAENKSAERVFVFYDEEIKLKTDEGGETIMPDNYRINTDFDPGDLSKGYILFIVPARQRSFLLSFGKNPASAVKVILNIQL